LFVLTGHITVQRELQGFVGDLVKSCQKDQNA
jgi:hypothetical protein